MYKKTDFSSHLCVSFFIARLSLSKIEKKREEAAAAAAVLQQHEEYIMEVNLLVQCLEY